MNFLELCERLVEETDLTSAPSSVLAQTGEAAKIVNWVKQAWIEIQQAARWDWLKGDFTVQTTSGDGEYTPSDCGITRFKLWIPNTFRIYKTSEGQATEQYLVEQDYNWFRDVYLFGGQASQTGRPTQFAIKPETKAILLGDKPDGIYTLYGRYWKSPQTLAADADELDGIPDEFEMLVVYKAMMKYASFDAASEVYNSARGDYRTMFMRMSEQCLPLIELEQPLA